ncbi:MAG: PilZ domain-containing protein [Candidatus Methylomirabilales bacterium]
MSKNLHTRKPPRFRISGVTAAVTTLQEADVLDLSLEGALVEHQDMLPLGSPCFLQLGIAGETLNVRCHVVHSRVSRRELGGGLYFQSGLEFLDLPPEAEQSLGALIRSYGVREDGGSRNPDNG